MELSSFNIYTFIVYQLEFFIFSDSMRKVCIIIGTSCLCC